MDADTVIKDATIVTHDRTFKGGVAIRNGKISAIAEEARALPQSKNVIDGSGKHLIPGLVDAHMHLHYPHNGLEPNLQSESQSSAAGGVTTIIHLLLTPDGLLKNAEKFVKVYEDNGVVDLNMTAAIFSEDDVAAIPDLVKFGMPAVKFLLPYRGTEALDGMPGIDDGILYLGLSKVAELAAKGYRVFSRVHTENVEIFERRKHQYLKLKNQNFQWGDVRDKICELDSLAHCIQLARMTKCPLYVVHMTVGEGPGMVARARAEGVNVTAETCPQYLVLTKDEAYGRILGKVNPPLREKWDNEQLWEGLKNGSVSVIGSDHAPCKKVHKKEFWSAHVGMAAVETMLPIMLSEGVNKGRLSFERVVETCCYNPAKIYGLAPRKGCISIGSDADLVLIDLKKKVKIKNENLHTQADYCVFEDKEVTGWPVATWLRGELIMKDNKILAKPGYGRWIAADVAP